MTRSGSDQLISIVLRFIASKGDERFLARAETPHVVSLQFPNARIHLELVNLELDN